MTIRVGINGFGRIGRNFFRAAKASGADIDFVAVNDLGSIDTMAHLLKYDSVLGRFPEKVTAAKSSIKVGGDTLPVIADGGEGVDSVAARPRCAPGDKELCCYKNCVLRWLPFWDSIR